MSEGERSEAVLRLTKTAKLRTMQPTVSIIVTASNYGRFLYECLSSCLKQTVQPLEVIYCDDASTDNSLAVARRFPYVQTIACKHHVGVVEARNRAARASRGDVLIHVDGDDQLTDAFVERHLAALRPDTPFVYGPAQAFGLQNCYWGVRPWGELPLWEMNFCNSSSAIWRWAFEAAGGWQENPSGTFWDWDLFLRASRFGDPAPSEAVLLYRQHSRSWSHSNGESEMDIRIKLLGMVRRSRAKLSVGCVYSGRLPKLMPDWMKSVSANCRRAGIRPDLTILDNSRRGIEKLKRVITPHEQAFSVVRIIELNDRRTWKTEQERRNGVSEFLARAYGRLLHESTGELCLWIEDDVILPTGGLKKMLVAVTDGYPMPAAVAGCYQNRHTGTGWVSGWIESGLPQEIDKLPKGKQPLEVDITGTGCLLFWKRLAPPAVNSFLASANGPVAAHDWAFTHAMRQAGRKVLLLPSVRCRHYKTAKEWV